MRRDPKAFRERFKAWKNGLLVYLSGRPTELPGYEGGKDEQNWYDKFVELHPTISTVASFLPIVGTAMDVYDAYKDPTAKNIGYAALSAATDLIGGKVITKLAGKAILRHRQLKKITKAVEKELSDWPYYKNMNPTKAKREIRALAKQEADRAVDKMDLPEELLSGFLRTTVPVAVYTPDFVANISQLENRNVGHKNGKDEDGITTLREITVTPNKSYAMASSDDMRKDLQYNIARAQYKNNLDAYNLLRNMNVAQEGVAMNFGLPLVMGLAGSPLDVGVEGAINLGKVGLNLLRHGGKSLARVGGDVVRLGNIGLGKRFKLNYYTDFITGESIAPAYIPTEHYPKIRPIDSYIGTSFSNSTVPRMAAQRTKMSPRQIALEADRAASGNYFEFPEQAYIEAGKKNVGGLYNPRKNLISIREGRADEALTHEVRHRLDQYMPLTESELKYLNNAFTSDFDAMKDLPAYKDVDLGVEKVTTIGDARRALLGDQKDWVMPWKQQNIEIDKARDVDIIDALLKSNGYGKSYVEQLMKKYGNVPAEVIKAVREAMKYVGVGSGVAVLKPKSKKQQLSKLLK